MSELTSNDMDNQDEIEYLPPPPGSKLDMTLEGLDVGFALSALKRRPISGDRRRRVIELRYGLLDGAPKTLREIAEIYGRSRTLIRRDELDALFDMRELRDSLRPEKVFQRKEIFGVDNVYYYNPNELRALHSRWPSPQPEFYYPEEG